MIEPTKPSPDIDALARRLPRRPVGAERAQALRRRLLDAAAQPEPSWLRDHARGVWLGAALAAALCAVIAWRTLAGRPAPQPASAPAIAAAPSAAAPSLAAPSPASAPSPAAAPSPASAPLLAAAVVSGEPLDDGVHAVRATRATQLVRGDATITAPAGAQFDVDVRDGHVRVVTVQAGWVVIAAAGHAATMVVERQSWTLPDPAPAPAVTPASPSAPAVKAAATTQPPSAPAPAAPPRVAAASDVRSAAPRTPSELPASARAASREAAEAPAAEAPTAAPTPPVAPVQQHTASHERDFRDGLRALLAGEPRQAMVALDRACQAPSSAQADICYWAVVARLRTGDQVGAKRGLEDLLIRFPGATHAAEASVALGWLLLQQGDRAGARARFAAAAGDAVPSVRTDALRGLSAAH